MTRTPGGGGWGDPRERDPREVARDVREGYITRERAREVYAVVVDARTGEVDGEGTAGVAGGSVHEGCEGREGGGFK